MRSIFEVTGTLADLQEPEPTKTASWRRPTARHAVVCDVCGATFTTSRANQKRCPASTGRDCWEVANRRNTSRLCKERRYRRVQPQQRTCDVCGRPFVPIHSKQLRCSKACQVEGGKRRDREKARLERENQPLPG